MSNPFVLTRHFFAIKRDEQPHFVIYPQEGSYGIRSPQALEAWTALYRVQSEGLRDSAIAGSMFGWRCPAAEPAVVWAKTTTPLEIPVSEGQS